MRYFYATYNYNVHEVFYRKKTSSYRFYRELNDLPWYYMIVRLDYLYTCGDINKDLLEKGSFMSGRKGGSVMIIDLEFDGNFKRSTGKEVYEAAIKKLQPILRERQRQQKIDSIL